MLYRNALFVALALSSACSQASEQNSTQDRPASWLSFDAGQDMKPGDPSGWTYRNAGENGCAGFNPTQGALCLGNDARIHWYYNGYNSDHMGWLRFGSLYRESNLTVENSALGLMATGGVFKDNNTLITQGAEIKDVAALKTALNTNTNSFANVPLPGSIPLYYKNSSSTKNIDAFAGMNRLTQWIWLPADPGRRERQERGVNSNFRPNKTVAWYPFLDDSKGGHYYHHITNRAAGGWILAQWDPHPTHHNGGPYAENHAFNEGGRDAPFNGREYFSRITAFSMVYHTASNNTSPYSVVTDEWQLFYKVNENDETIGSLAIGYDPEFNDFDVSFEDKYRCQKCDGRYALYVSTKPITQHYATDATRISAVENYFIDDDNPMGDIIKPNNYYNQVWARFTLPEAFNNSFLNGTSLYFAVVDLSERQAYEQDADRELVIIDGDAFAKNELVKTIKYTGQKNVNTATITGSPTLRIPSGIESTITLSSSRWETGYTWVAEANNDLSILINTPSENNPMIKISANGTGEYYANFRLKNIKGELLDRFSVQVISQRQDCRQKTNCPHYTIAEFGHANNSHDLPISQWHTVIKDTYTNPVPEKGMGITIGSNGSYNFAGVKGERFTLGNSDVLTFKVKNTTSQNVQLSPKLSLTSVERTHSQPSEWISLLTKTILPGETVSYEIHAADLPTTTFSVININLPINQQGILLKSIGLHSEKSFFCEGCITTLVDFYFDGLKHNTPYSDWSKVFYDIYTGKVGERGMGIIIGQNGGYNYQGVRGESPLPEGASHIILRWKNESNKVHSFRPKVSFNDQDRADSGEYGEWVTLDSVTLQAGETRLQYVPIPEGKHHLVNVSVNANQQKELSLTQIMMD